jgi:hypothetical protein
MWIGEDIDIASTPPITARRGAMWLELLAMEGDTTIAASS